MTTTMHIHDEGDTSRQASRLFLFHGDDGVVPRQRMAVHLGIRRPHDVPRGLVLEVLDLIISNEVRANNNRSVDMRAKTPSAPSSPAPPSHASLFTVSCYTRVGCHIHPYHGTAHDATSPPKHHLDVFRAGQAHVPQHDLSEAASRDFPCASLDWLTVLVHVSDLDFLVPPMGCFVKVWG